MFVRLRAVLPPLKRRFSNGWANGPILREAERLRLNRLPQQPASQAAEVCRVAGGPKLMRRGMPGWNRDLKMRSMMAA